MTNPVSEMKQNLCVYARTPISHPYIDRLKGLCQEFYWEPWDLGQPEPAPSEDLSKFNIILTYGVHDTLQILKKAPNVKWVQSLSVGIDATLHEQIISSDLIITNTRGCSNIPIAEHTLSCISALARGIPSMLKNQAVQKWSPVEVRDLSGSTVGIIGYGEIGIEIARRCKALDMKVIGCRRNPSKNASTSDPADLIVGIDGLDFVLSESDFLVLALPATNDTYHFFNRDNFKKVKQGCFLINIGRGNTIQEEALIEAIHEGRIAGAALDVFEAEPLPQNHPFWQLENVIISPHYAYFSPKTFERRMGLFIENLHRFAKDEPLINVINKKVGY